MESQNKEKEYEHSVWEIYRKEWAIASPDKKIELNKRMLRWQELMKDGLSASQAYYKAMEEDLKREVIEVVSPESTHRSRWSWMFKATSAVLALGVVVAVIYGVVITVDRNALNNELQSVKSVLSTTNQTLVKTQGELTSTKQTLVSTQGELSSTKQTLASTQSELGSTKQTLTSTQSELSRVSNILTSVESELGATKEKLKLYEETLGVEVFSGVLQLPYKKPLSEYVNLTNNPSATNPTWSKLMAFLYADPTDDEYYNPLNFNCTNFAERLHNNAEAKGIRATFVAVFFSDNEKGHALNAFTTTDKGLVYVDCTGGDSLARLKERLYGYTIEYDSIAYVWKGEEYRRWSIDKYTFQNYRYYKPYRQTSDWERYGIVESIRIYW